MIGQLEVRGPHGRLDVSVGGPADGAPLILHDGTPAGALLFAPSVEVAAARGARLVTYSRPGYAGSARHAGRSVADCAADVAAVADALGIERFHTVGQSGGGPHALATAALLPERVIAAATTGGVAPWAAAGLDFLAGMGPENHEEFGAAAAGEAELRPYLDEQAAVLRTVTGEQVAAAMGELMSEVDRRALSGAYADHMARSARVALEHGIDGWLDDDLAFTRDWGFELAAITRPVTVWQGDEDRFVPFSHGQWLAAHTPGARARLLHGQGHLSIALELWGEVVDELLSAVA